MTEKLTNRAFVSSASFSRFLFSGYSTESNMGTTILAVEYLLHVNHIVLKEISIGGRVSQFCCLSAVLLWNT